MMSKLEKKCVSKAQVQFIDETKKIFRAIDHKLYRIEFHVKQAEQIYKTIFEGKNVVKISEYVDDLNNVAYEIEAMIDTLNVLPDICAQLINLIMLSSGISKNEVSIFKIRDNLFNPNLHGLKNEIKRWIKSEEFNYIRGFCNVSKHYSLIDRDYYTHIDYLNKSLKRGIRFLSFEYNKPHCEKMMTEIFTIKDGFIKQFWKVIEEIEKLV